GHLVGLPAAALAASHGLHGRDLAPQLGDPLVDAPAVRLQLRLTGTTQTDTTGGAARPAACLPGQRLTPTTQARQQVLQLGQLDLRLALPGPRVLGEDVQDERDPVDDLDLELLLQLAQLAGRQVPVDDHRVGSGGAHHV